MDTAKKRPNQKSRHNRAAAAVAALILAAVAPVWAAVADVTVVYTGETHAMLHPCDCPDDPGGGLAERAAFLGGVAASRDNLLLLDGGGFSGGGIYDTYSAGRAADSARTAKTIAAMGLMGYDAVGIGDDDLIYGAEWLARQASGARLPLVSANVFGADGRRLAAPYILVKKGKNTYGITSVTTAEKLFPIDSSIIIKDPLASLESIRKELKRKSNYQILISHLGEEETEALLGRMPGYFLLAANGHRKISVQPLATMSKTPVLNFGYQGKSMAYAVLGWKNRSMRLLRSGRFGVDGGAGVDARVLSVVGEPKKPAAAAAEAVADANIPEKIEDADRVYDLYIMSACPYGIQAMGELVELSRAFPQREWNVWFIGKAEDDKLSSRGGEAEMFDEMLWLGVKALYPFRYHEFLFLRAGSKASTEDLLEGMDLDVRRIRRWAEDMGPAELRQHYIRSMRLNVSASPTLYVNNNLRGKPISSGRLVREECRLVEVEPPFCSDYPECFEDSDCIAKGKIGRCLEGERAVCEFRDDAVFTLTILIADSAVSSPEKPALAAIEELLPGMRVNIVKLHSDEGRELMSEHVPPALPFFHFEKEVVGAQHFSEISGMLLEATAGGYAFKSGVVRKNYFPLRQEKRGLAEVYADPLMPDIGKVINTIIENSSFAGRVVIRPLIYRDPGSAGMTAQDKLRAEEALRWLVLAEEFPKKYHQYLKIYAGNPSGYWFNWLKGIGINKKKFLRRLEANKAKTVPHWENFAEVSTGEPVVVLVNNRMKAVVGNERELERVLKSAGY